MTNHGAGLRLNGLIMVPSEFGISFDNFRTMRRCRLIWGDGDLSVHRFKEVSNVGYALRVLIYCVAAVGVGMPPSLLAFVGLALIGF